MRLGAFLGLLLAILPLAKSAFVTRKLATAISFTGNANQVGDLLDEEQNTDAEVNRKIN
jgi:hypothetical protein